MKAVNRVNLGFKSDVNEWCYMCPSKSSGPTKVGGVLPVRVGNSLKIVWLLNALQFPPVSIFSKLSNMAFYPSPGNISL